MASQILWILASMILLLLGATHLYYTFFTNRFSIRNKEVEEGMKNSYPVLTARTTVWKAWIGFNASHSLCAIYMALINILFAVEYYELLKESVSIKSLTVVSAFFLLYLGKRYWFNIPFTGIFISCICYTFALFLM